ncbi:MAG TPA: hypothetical protein VGP22_12060 [Albitalea sp.]|nr:hypothetical protein [Albitalea sp.]
MDKSPLASNPFALMMNPEDVIQAMQRSDRLGRLQRRICKPLDKPLIPHTPDEVAAFDHDVDDSADIADIADSSDAGSAD